jgi:YidC/Oxa1 family membrane protein insertase
MDKKAITGFVLIFILLIVFQYISKPSEEQLAMEKKLQDSIELVKKNEAAKANTIKQNTFSDSTDVKKDSNKNIVNKAFFGVFAPFSTGTENEYKLENKNLEITFTNKGGRIKNIKLKKYESWLEDKDHKKIVNPVRLLDYPTDNFELILPVAGANNNLVNTKDLYFKVVQDKNQIDFIADNNEGVSIVQSYKISPDNYQIDYDVKHAGLNTAKGDNIMLKWDVALAGLEKSLEYEKTYSSLYYKTAKDVSHLSFTSNDNKDESNNKIEWISNVNQFFNSTLMNQGGKFENAKFEVIVPDKNTPADYMKICKSSVELEGSKDINLAFYVGPNEFNNLKAYNNNLEMIISYGWNIFGAINRWVVRPMFLFLYNIVGSMGLAIIVLIFIIKGMLSPLNHKMLLSSAKMQALKPEIDKLKEKHKDDLQQQQVKTMELYRKYGVSPFGGCLPMLLQMPIWIALFRFFPASIEFRQVPFLWAPDLSSYESIYNLPFSIPMYGSHVSLFALLWGISSVIYAHYNMKNMDMGTSQNQAMKYMQYAMPIFFIVFFNSYASGLNVYMFFSNLFTILQTTITKRFFIDEEKIRAKLEIQKEKPKKKSKFTQRLEDAMKQQQALAEQKKKGK